MATTTYNYVGITNPSSTHLAYSGAGDPVPPASGADIPNAAELSSANYVLISVDDSLSAQKVADYPGFEFKLKIAEVVATITQIYAYVDGSAQDGGNNGTNYNFYIKNFNTSAWELLGTGPGVLTGTITTNITNYISGSYLYLLVHNNNSYDCQFPYQQIDYVYVTITYTTSSIKTIDGLAKASIKTIDGLAIGSVKTRDGLV